MDNTLYYTLSAIPQVLGAIATIIVAVIHFRIQNLQESLIGYGKSVKDYGGLNGYELGIGRGDMMQNMQLDDAINRKNIPLIKDVICQLAGNDRDQGCARKDRPTGMKYIFDQFCRIESYLKKLKKITLIFFIFSFSTIIASIVSLAKTDSIVSSIYLSRKYWVLWGNVSLFIASLVFAFFLMRFGMSEKIAYENYIPTFEKDDKKTTQTDGVKPPTNSVPKQ